MLQSLTDLLIELTRRVAEHESLTPEEAAALRELVATMQKQGLA